MPPRTSSSSTAVMKPTAATLSTTKSSSSYGQRKSKSSSDSSKGAAIDATTQSISKKKQHTATSATESSPATTTTYKGSRNGNKNGNSPAKDTTLTDRAKRVRAPRAEKKAATEATANNHTVRPTDVSQKVKSKLTAAVNAAQNASANHAKNNNNNTGSTNSKQQSRTKQSSNTSRASNNNGAAPATPQRKSRRSPAAVTPSSASKQQATGSITILQHHSQNISSSSLPLSNDQTPAMSIKQASPSGRSSSPVVAGSPPSRPTRDHAYAGPTFSNSPAASRLPMPDILLGGSTINSNSHNNLNGQLPSLSPASSTTSLHQYSMGYSAPPSPTRVISNIDMLLPVNSNEHTYNHTTTTTQYDSADELRMRSRELLDMLRGSHTTSTSTSNHPYQQHLSSTSYSPTTTHLSPPSHAVQFPTTNSSYTCDPFYVGQSQQQVASSSSSLVQPSFSDNTAFTVESYRHQAPPPPNMSEWQATASNQGPSAGDKMLINEMYSSNLRALLKIDVRA